MRLRKHDESVKNCTFQFFKNLRYFLRYTYFSFTFYIARVYIGMYTIELSEKKEKKVREKKLPPKFQLDLRTI